MPRVVVRVTQNFERNLEEIRAFLEEQEAQAFDALLHELDQTIVPNLERFPDFGRDFLKRAPQSAEGMTNLERVLQLLDEGASVREYIAGDYVLLYLHRDNRVYLLAVKHHKQLSFDLGKHWL